jgi:uncharacterized protein
MKVMLTGGSGFVGRHLCRHFLERGDAVTAVGRRSAMDAPGPGDFTYRSTDTERADDWTPIATNADVVINLAGASIFRRWNRRYKIEIRESRIQTTRRLVEALPEGKNRVLISTSAIGYYGDGGEAVMDEETPAGDDFLAGIAADWERAAVAAEAKGTRVCRARFGVVLGPEGGAMAKMVPAFRSGLGGPVGNGRQWFSWIHIEDLAAAVDFLIERKDLSGPFNFTAPEPIRQGDFARLMGRGLNRPALMPAPAFMLRMMLGEFADTLLQSQRVVPRRLTEAGFGFRFANAETALTDLI